MVTSVQKIVVLLGLCENHLLCHKLLAAASSGSHVLENNALFQLLVS